MAQQNPYNDSQRHRGGYSPRGAYGRGIAHRGAHTPTEASTQFQPKFDYTPRASKSAESIHPTSKWAGGVKRNTSSHVHLLNDDTLDGCLEDLQSIWHKEKGKLERCNAVYSKLAAFLRDCSNPWQAVLYFFTHAADYEQAKTASLSFTILAEFEKWLDSSDNCFQGREEEFIFPDLQVRVFHATTGRYISFLNSAVKAFRMDHPGNGFLVPMIRIILSRGKLTEAAQVAARLGLQSHFSQEEILVPLLLTDKLNVIESYITGNPEQQALILSLLDHLCARNTDLYSFAQTTGVKNIKGEKMKKKVLSKFAMRLMKLYDIPAEACPNISENRAMGAIRYLLYKRYVEKSIGYSGWDDMVESAVGKNDNLKQQLIMELIGYNDVTEAVKWADRYNLADHVLDPCVVEARAYLRQERAAGASGQPVEGRDPEGEEEWGREVEPAASIYYSMALPESSISVVDNPDKLQLCLDTITQPHTMVGIDAEWKPCMGASSERVALLQLAVRDHVFLVDFMELRPLLTEDKLVWLTESIFCDEQVLKIGYSLETDLRMLIKTFPCMEEPLMRMARVVDVEKLASKIYTEFDSCPTDISPTKEDTTSATQGQPSQPVFKQPWSVSKNEEKGLSLLVKKMLGKPLSKGEQMSNWEKRPLRQSQITYAAADAYVLLDVYNALASRGQAMGLSPSELEPAVTLRVKSHMDKKKEKSTAVNRSRQNLSQKPLMPAHSSSVRSPRELRVVCDTMLQGLGSQLRTCGVDALILSSAQKHSDAIQICKREKRIVLSSGKAYDQVRASVGENMCHYVRQNISAREQCLEVLQHFLVQVTKEDIFSRCSACNSQDLVLVPSADMYNLYIHQLQLSRLMFGAAAGWDGGGMNPSLADIDPGTFSKFLKYGIDPTTITFLHNGVKILVETVPKPEVFSQISSFFVCTFCGKVFWEGSHHEKICTKFASILNLDPLQVLDKGCDSVQPGDLLVDSDSDLDEKNPEF